MRKCRNKFNLPKIVSLGSMANNQKFNHQRNKTGIPGDVKCDYDEADLLWKELAVNRPLSILV